ncbi:hypothetical protein [Bacillus timonensis]|nr:hypothetical protein [Bacillus timonensis]
MNRWKLGDGENLNFMKNQNEILDRRKGHHKRDEDLNREPIRMKWLS